MKKYKKKSAFNIFLNCKESHKLCCLDLDIKYENVNNSKKQILCVLYTKQLGG